MNQDESRIAQLILKDLREGLTIEEQLELDAFKKISEENRLFVEQYNDEAYLQFRLKQRSESDARAGWEKFSRLTGMEEAVVIPITQRKWFKVSAAASVLAIISLAGFLWVTSTRPSGGPHPAAVSVETDLVPGSDKAVLLLADGTTINLDAARNGSLASQGSTIIRKQDGSIMYKGEEARAENAVLYNTVSTPRGGQYHVVLPDGSKVWLNAASAIRFPTTFTRIERRVEISGEAYFEIAHDAARPFTVATADQPGKKGAEVTVLGTHFNVNAYAEESSVKVTLVEGKVKVMPVASATVQYLSPGQQARITDNGNIQFIKTADIAEALAWKNGVFRFGGSDIHTIMRQLSRWYDVEVTYKDDFSDLEFVGQISRYNNASKVLQLLEMTGGVHFKITGKKIIVTK